MSSFNINAKSVRLFLVSLITILACSWGAYGQELGGSGLTPFQEKELAYADKLMRMGLAAYSQKIIDGLNLPSAILDIRRVNGLCAQGKFDEAEALVNTKKGDDSEKAWTLRIALADGYYMWGKYDKAEKIYTGFFKKFPNGPADKALQGFYLTSAYKYSQMMLMLGKKKEAIVAYKKALAAKPPRHVERQLMGELVELMIQVAEQSTGAPRDNYIKQASKYIDKILWVQDLWFGRAIVSMAHIKKMQGDIEGAMKLIDEYKPQLKSIEASITQSSKETGEDFSKLSPMAECRYMIGVIMQDEASKILKSGGDKNKARELLMGKKIGVRRNGKPRYSSGALQHFLNVFVKYPNTSWAPDAGRRFREIKAQLADEWDIHTKAKISKEQMQAVEEAQFKEARVLFNQQRFKEAIDAYEQVLSLFPESDTSIAAMGELASCYIEEKEFMFADVVTRHLAERFCRNKKYMIPAGDRVVSIAYKYSEIGDKDRMRATYNTFFKYMTKHPRAAAEIYRFGNQEFAAKNYDAAMDYYKQIIEHHKDANVYTDALSRMAMIYDAQGKYKAEIKVLKVLIAILKKQDNPGQLLVSAMFRYARSLEALGPKYTDYAIAKYKALEKLLADKDARLAYQNSADEAKANIQILQAAMLKHAMADCKRKTVPPKVQAAFNKKYKRKVKPEIILNGYYKKNAIKILEKLVSEFPKSVYAPTALSQIGSLYTILKKPDDARKVLQRLQKDYPDSPEAKNVVFTLASSMLELGMRKEAINHFKQMFSGSGKFSASQILQAGKVLYDAEEYSTAIEAFDRVIKTEKSRAYLEPAKVRKALALNKLGKYDEAAKVFRSLLKDYPKSGYTVEICRGASEAYSAVAGKTADDTQRMTLFNEAIDALSRARKFAKDPGVKASLNIASAQISEDKSAAELQFGTKEKSEQYRNEAVAAYQSVIMFSDPKKKQLAPAIEEAYVRCLPLMMEMGRWDDVLQDADNYIKFFPHGKYNRKIRQFKNKARVSGGEAQKPADTEVDGGATTTSPDTTATTKEK